MSVDAAMGRRIELSLAECARHYATDHYSRFPEHGAEVLEVGGPGGGLAVWASRFGAPNISRAFALGMEREVTAEHLSQIEAFYAKRDARVRVVTSPWTHPSLFALFATRGYVVESFDNILVRSIGAGVDLAAVSTDPGSESQRKLEVRCGFRIGYSQVSFDAPRVTAPS